MLRKVFAPCVTLMLTGAAHSAMAAGPEPGAWRWSFATGATLDGHGDATRGASGSLADAGALDPTLAGSAGALSTGALRTRDLFRPAYRIDVEAARGLTDGVEAFYSLAYGRADGRRDVTIGQLTAPVIGADEDVTAHVGARRTFEFGAGARYYFAPGEALRPYVTASVGALHYDAVDATLRAATPGSPDVGTRFLRAGTVPTGAIGGGLDFAVTPRADVALDVTARYARAQKVDASALTGDSPLVERAGGQWAVPVTLRASYHF